MRKNIRFLTASIFLLIIALGAPRAQSTQPTDSLGGKTVHVYLPSAAIDTLVIQNLNIQMKQDAQYWYSYTFTKAGLYDYQDGFYFTDPSHRVFFSKSGLGGTESPRFLLADFQGTKEIWIIVDPAGSPTAKPVIMTQAPKIVNILNPWPTTAPKLLSGAKTRNMTTVSGHCGWFSAMLLDTTMTKGHFAELSDAGTYGKSGFSGTDDFDFSALFAQYGPTIWLNTETNSWTGAYPNVDGTCQYMMAMTVRDFSKSHPDFDVDKDVGDVIQKGMVEAALGPNAKPVRSAKAPSTAVAVTFDTFDSWWKTDTTNTDPKLRSYESCYDLPMSKSSDGLWEYDSYRDSKDHGFWPVEGAGLNRFSETMASCYVKPPPDTTVWVTGGPARNGNFCAEAHANFIYKKGQKFAFRGDDDVWAFIDGKLVIDLGGKHTPKSDSVNLDDPKLGLTEGKTYKWDFFYCDRQHCGSSLRIKTSIFFLQQRSLYGEQEPGPTPGSIILKIWKRQGGTGSCGSVGADTTSKPASNLTYQLLDAAGKVVKDLANPGSFYGGITIAEPQIAIDTSKLVPGADLVAGQTYRVVAFEPANQKVRVEVPFKVPVRNYVDFDSPASETKLAGQLIMVIASNRDQTGAKAAGALSYVPIVPAGLPIYTDAAGTVPAPAILTTNADGLDTLWVTAKPTADQPYTLSLPPPAKLAPKLTFIVPTDRVEFVPPLARDTLIGQILAIKLQTLDNKGVQAKPLAYTLKIPAGLKVFSDAAGTAPITGGTTGADGTAIIYATATDSSEQIDKSYTLEIVGSNSIKLTFHLPALDLPKLLSAGIYDDDGDGIADRIEATFDRDITAAPPKSAAYKWPSSAAAVPVSGADAAKGAAGKVLTLKGQFSTAILTSGTGTFSAVYQARKVDSTQSVNLDEYIGPVIKTAVISLGKTEDTVRVIFSEATSRSGPSADAASWFAIKRAADGAVEHVAPSLPPTWTDDRSQVTFIYPNTNANVPRAGNLIRAEDGKTLITDERGNTAGPASRFRVITGDKRLAIETVPIHKLKPLVDGSAKPILVSMEPTTAVATEVVDRTGRMGHLLKIDLGAYAVGDDFNPVSPSQVTLDYEVHYFTNHGLPVNDDKGSIACTDPVVFQGNCVAHRGFVFIGWNGTTKSGDKAATGAYVARLRYSIKVAGQAKENGGMDRIWGVVRAD